MDIVKSGTAAPAQLPEQEKLIPGENPTNATTQEYVVIACVFLIKFADAVEIYLPGIITQQVSCEMDLGHLEEGVLGVSIYCGITVTSFLMGPISEILGRRTILLGSMYTCVLTTAFCAVVPNYWTLLLSRVLIGLSIGMNASTAGVYLGEMVKSEELCKTGSFVGSLSYAARGGWIGILGYALLERLGWRVFLLCTSIPLFIIPILLFQFYLPESPFFEGQTEKPSMKTVMKGVKLLAVQLALLRCTSSFQGQGSILLLPSFMKHDNEQRGLSGTLNCSAIFGIQFLILALVMGVFNFLGRILGFSLHGHITFRKYMLFMVLVSGVSYGCMFFTSNIVYLEVSMGIIKLMYAAMSVELSVQTYNPRVLGSESFAMSCALIKGLGYIGAALGNALAVFTPDIVSISSCFGLCLVNIGIIYTVC